MSEARQGRFGWLRGIFWLAIVYLVASVFLGVWWSWGASEFDVNTATEERLSLLTDTDQTYTGSYTTATLIELGDILLSKPGGFLSNDMTPPGIWLDNQPNWEYGMLIQIRDMSKALREAFSRSQSQSTEDQQLARAESRFNVDHNNWIMPAAEDEYEKGIAALEDYLARLVDADSTNAQFYARSDNLRYWLRTVETRLGSLSQRLSASVGQRRLNTDLAGENEASQSTAAPKELEVKTSFWERDDVFYEARGSTFAILHLMKAIEKDFGSVLDKKNARVSVQQIIRELEGTQEFVWSPMILNGKGFGFVANHSLVMASYISRANAALIDLRELLAQG
ncbi:DUF2333 family protein [Halioxenophilus aromaticivorans]